MQSRREQPLLFLAVALPNWFLLLFLLGPSITRGGDCGELISASYRLGIAHPSGYPIWCLLGRLFAFLPLGEIAWRYNLFSSICGALASGFVTLAAYRVGLSLLRKDDSKPLGIQEKWLLRWAVVAVGLLFTGAYQIGTQFIIAEVYSGAALVDSAILYFTLIWIQEGDRRDFFTLALLAGIALAVHLSVIFILPWAVIAALWKRGVKAPHVGLAVFLGLVGFSPILYLPIRSAPFPQYTQPRLSSYFYAPLDWGHPSSFTALKNHITGAQYRRLLITTETHVENGRTVTTRRLSQSPREIPRRLNMLGQFVLLHFLWGTPLILVGMLALYRADKRIFWLLFFIAGSNIGIEINYDVADQSNFFFPAYIVMSLWAGAGWFVFVRFLAARGSLATALGPILVGATVAAQWSIFAPNASLRHVTRVRDGALEQAAAMETLATQVKRPVYVILPADDLMWAFWYVKFVLNKAPNVETLWGQAVNLRHSDGKLAPYVGQMLKRGPVCMGVWDEAVDARYPFVMLSPSGNVCVASTRKLPLPAAPLAPEALGQIEGKPAPNGLLSARFRRTPLWRGDGKEPHISVSSTAAFEVDFSVPSRWRPAKADQVGGTIEVLMAQTEKFGTKGPKPTERATPEDDEDIDPSEVVVIQKRRLVLPAGAKAHQLLRAAVPLDIDMKIGTYDVWTRLALPGDTKPPAWTHTDRVTLTQK